ncbi:hypothetical protein KM043_013508 [Ampulex compressa]|nr:hypothetical protein KM043_013508 [Ampulex compressa]
MKETTLSGLTADSRSSALNKPTIGETNTRKSQEQIPGRFWERQAVDLVEVSGAQSEVDPRLIGRNLFHLRRKYLVGSWLKQPGETQVISNSKIYRFTGTTPIP